MVHLPVFPMLSSNADSLIILVLFLFTVAVVSLLLLLQVYTVCFLKRSAEGSPAGGEAQDADAAAAAVLGTSFPVLLGGGEPPGDCVVCLSALEADGDEGRVLPLCRHAFHARCIGRWLLASHSISCPICRTPVMGTEAAPAAAPGAAGAAGAPLIAAAPAGSREDVEAGRGDADEVEDDQLLAAAAVSAAIDERRLPLLLLY